MTIDKYIKEEFLTYKKKLSELYGIYINPSRSELKQLVKEEEIKPIKMKREGTYRDIISFRFIADKTNKKIYVFNYNFLHEYVLEFFEKEKILKNLSYQYILRGILNYDIEKDVFDTYSYGIEEWAFLDEYVDKLNRKNK